MSRALRKGSCLRKGNQERYAAKCIDRLKQWEQNPNCPCEIELYYDSAPHSFGFRQVYPDGRTGIVGGLLYHGQPDQSFAVLLNPIHGWTIHT